MVSLGGRQLDWKQCLGGFLLIPLGVVLRGFLGYGSSYLLAWSGQRITNDVKTDAFRKVSSLSLDFFQRTTTSELIARIERDGANLNSFLRLGLSDLIKEPVTIVSILATMLLIDWKFTLISLAFVPLCVIPTRQVMKRVKDLPEAGLCHERGPKQHHHGIVSERSHHQGLFWKMFTRKLFAKILDEVGSLQHEEPVS